MRGVETKSNFVRGVEAENIALDFLLAEGFKLLHRNWRSGHKELDLVMRSNRGTDGKPLIHIVEVKSLSYPYTHFPHESVTKSKQKRLIAAAAGYIKYHKIDFETRFDVVSIIFEAVGVYSLEYFPDAFSPEW